MITSHHSFSTRIFLKETPAVHSQVLPAAADTPDNLREFWWFLRGSQNAGGPSSREAQAAFPGLAGARPSTSKLPGAKHA